MKRIPFLAISILAMSMLGWRVDAGRKTDMPGAVSGPVAGYATDFTVDGEYGLNLYPAAYDYAKCIESCDKQYADCAKGGDAGRIKYCSDQHDQCRKACLEHK